MKVLVCGSRSWVAYKPIEEWLKRLPPDTVIIHGACRGVDNIAGEIACRLGFKVRKYPVPQSAWEKYGPVAGNMRNALMLKYEHPHQDGTYIDEVVAFHHDPKLGKGTRDMVARASKALPIIKTEVILRSSYAR